MDSEWTLGFALDNGASAFYVDYGVFKASTYNLTTSTIFSDGASSRTIDFGSGTVSLSGSTSLQFFNGLGSTETAAANLTVVAGTAQINCTATNTTFSGNGKTFYNVTFTGTGTGTATINGANTFNNLSTASVSSSNFRQLVLAASQTVNGTLTLPAGVNLSSMRGRTFVRSDTLGTTRTLTCAAVSMADADFRDITIAGAAAPASGARVGDCKGNSGITFAAAKTVYWNLAGGGNWTSNAWAISSGGTPDNSFFPLAQDTCVFEATGLNSGATITINLALNIGTIDMSARTANTMTITTSSVINVYGNWINGTGTTVGGGGTYVFGSRSTQTVTSAGQTFPSQFDISAFNGTVTLLDALTLSIGSTSALSINNGTFNANGFNVTVSAANGGVTAASSFAKTIAVGSGTWTIAGSGTTWSITSTGTTISGTGTISMTSSSAKTFQGGSLSYSSITLNQGGAGTLTITGNNTFANITNTYKATGATTINFGTTTQTVGSFTAAGEAGRVLTLTGSSASSPATLVLTSGTVTSPDYLTITGVRAYALTTTWYAGANSTNNGSLGWLFESSGGTTYSVSFSDTATGADAISSSFAFNASFSDSATGSDSVSSSFAFSVAFSDSATGADSVSAVGSFGVSVSDTARGSDSISSIASFFVSFSDTARGSDSTSATFTFDVSFSDTARGSDAPSVASSTFNATVSEFALALDALDAGLLYNVVISETAVAADTVSARYLWEVIDNGQAGSWVSVATSQTPNWTVIDDGQSPGWTQINTL
jgi:hypothetical protein